MVAKTGKKTLKSLRKLTDMQISFCGSAGDGTIAAGDIFKRAMAAAGYQIIAFDVYPPEIRGFGKCIARTRVTYDQVYSLKPESDVLLSLNDAHAIPHVGEVCDYGAVIYDDSPIANIEEGCHMSAHLKPAQLPYGVSFREISERATSSARSRNIVAVGFIAGLYGLPREVFHSTIAAKFANKPRSVTEINLKAFDLGYEQGVETFKIDTCYFAPPPKRDKNTKVLMMHGNAAVARGCIDAGIKNFFGYPITPATSIMEILATEMPKHGGRLLQTEDEISAIAGIIGAGFAGSRAATSTSGPGLALMSEMMGFGAMTEVPCVIFVSQRGGPSTGMPTKTEQSDLNLAVLGVAGDAQRIVLAPTNVEGCYKCAGMAFELSEKFQTPVIVLIDLYLSNRYEAVTLSRKSLFKSDNSKWAKKPSKREPFNRYKLTSDSISPRAIPGQQDCQHVITGLEHNEQGRPSDQPEMHETMSRKRHIKLQAAIDYPNLAACKRFGDMGKVRIGILSWGSTFGECLEAMFTTRKRGITCSAMKVVMLSPLPVDAIVKFMADCDEVIVVELNYEGQFANLVMGAVGRPVHRLNRVTGMPMAVDEIIAAISDLTANPSAARTAAQ